MVIKQGNSKKVKKKMEQHKEHGQNEGNVGTKNKENEIITAREAIANKGQGEGEKMTMEEQMKIGKRWSMKKNMRCDVDSHLT